MDAKKASDIALVNAIGVIISNFIWGPLELVIGILAIIIGIYALNKINKENAKIGKWKAIVAIVVGGLGIILGLISLLTLNPSVPPIL